MVHTILLVEDEENDVFFFRRCLASINAQVAVRVVGTAFQARTYIEGFGEFRDRRYSPMPDLIILDMHLPGATGLEFLHWLREREEARDLPVFFLSGSMPCEEIKAVLGPRVSGHFIKTPDFTRAKENVRQILKHLPVLPSGSPIDDTGR